MTLLYTRELAVHIPKPNPDISWVLVKPGHPRCVSQSGLHFALEQIFKKRAFISTGQRAEAQRG